MIVKNEEQCLGRCLDSVSGIVDEIIVVDTGSTDGTGRIAASRGALVMPHEWQDDFAAARNVSLSRATGAWVLSLDADEELDKSTSAGLKSLLATTSADALRLRLRNILPEGELCRFDESRLTRLFRNKPEFRYEGVIHEQIRPAIQRAGGVIADTELTIIHHGYAQKTAQGGQGRALRNLAILERSLARRETDAYLHFQLGITHKSLGRNEEAANHLRAALSLDSGVLDPEVLDTIHMKLAQLDLARNSYAEALRHAEASLIHNPGNTISLFVAALCGMYTGDIRRAYDNFLRIKQQPQGNVAKVDDLDKMLAFCGKTLGIPQG
jgi:tetratricopeptide (TPR) repeat protein